MGLSGPCLDGRDGYLTAMTEAVAHILEELEHLSPEERLTLGRLIVRRIPMTADLTEDDLAVVSAEVFAGLDAEEAARG